METNRSKNGFKIRAGDIVTRSDGTRFLITDPATGIYSDLMKEVAILPLTYKSAQYLIDKRVGEYFYEHGQLDYTITNIERTPLTQEYRDYYKGIRKAEEAERARIQEEETALAQEEEERKAKIRAVRQWFEDNEILMGDCPIQLDDEQAFAVANMNKNTLVAARAGSGKTSTLVAKIVYLVTKYEMPQDEIMAFVFNRKASEEINGRLSKVTMRGKEVFYNPQIATTFHAFARRVIYDYMGEAEKYGKILCDGKEGDFRTLYIQEIIKTMPKKKIYDFFRSEMFQIKKDKFASEAEFFESLRSSQYGTLDGKTVKSQGEKIICDYLFEHDIKYYYENEYYLGSAYSICRKECGKRLYELRDEYGEDSIKPDFYLPEFNIPWEHWGVDGDESFAQIQAINKAGTIGDYSKYMGKMNWKRWFFKKDWVDEEADAGKYALQIKQLKPLIETYASEVGDREKFERRIEELLRERGIYRPKLSEDELIRRVWESQVKRFSKMVTQFIDRAELTFAGDFDDLAGVVKNYNGDERTKVFLQISLECYAKYLENLLGEKRERFTLKFTKNNREYTADSDAYGIDFSILMDKAVEAIREGRSEELNANLARKRYLLVDEYQDFSELFLQLVLAVREYCPNAKMFAVGDDWQAFNRFAGSDTEYFENFDEYFPEDTCHLEITTNYRSRRNIVEGARVFMANSLGKHGNFVAYDQTDGYIQVVDPSKTEIDYKGYDDNIYKQVMTPSDDRNPRKYAVQYLKTVAEIVRGQRGSKKILILHRNNDMNLWMSINSFRYRLKKAMVKYHYMTEEEFDRKVEIMTIHRAKGLEADTVILLEADEGVIPAYHQDTCLYEIFGDSEETAMIDQKKLFYVAVTRPKKNLYILHKFDKNRNGFMEFCEYPIVRRTEE